MENQSLTLPKGTLRTQKLYDVFDNHLNRIYCAKSHLEERLPEILIHVHFADLIQAITETLVTVNQQIKRMDEMFEMVGIKQSFKYCDGLIKLMEDLYDAIHHSSHDPILRDLSIFFYLQNIASIEKMSFRVLTSASADLENNEAGKLLEENFDEACEEHHLLHFIIAKYVK